MFAALIIVFREVVEAGLVVGVVLAVTQSVPQRLRYVFGGIAAGVLGASIVALFTGLIAEALAGTGQEVLNASVLSIAVVMLTWHNVWMARHGREMTQELSDFGAQVSRGAKSLVALAIVVAVAVLREGSEIVLFLYGVLVSGGTTVLSVFIGGVLGLCGGVAVAYLTFRGLITIPMRHLFRVTTLLISFIAAGMAAQAVGFLDQADIVIALDRTVWDTSWLLPDDSWVGRIAHTLLGYTDQPTELQLIVYVAVLAAIFVLMKVFAPPRRPVVQLAPN